MARNWKPCGKMIIDKELDQDLKYAWGKTDRVAAGWIDLFKDFGGIYNDKPFYTENATFEDITELENKQLKDGTGQTNSITSI